MRFHGCDRRSVSQSQKPYDRSRCCDFSKASRRFMSKPQWNFMKVFKYYALKEKTSYPNAITLVRKSTSLSTVGSMARITAEGLDSTIHPQPKKRRNPPTRPMLEAVTARNFILCDGGRGDIAANDPVVNRSLIEILYKNGLYGTILSYRNLRRLQAGLRLSNFGQATLRAMEPAESTATPSR